MTFTEALKGLISTTAGALGKVLNSDLFTVVKAGVLIGSAIVTVVKAVKAYKASKKARTGESDDTMTSFMRFSAKNHMDNPVADVIRRNRKIFSDDEVDDFLRRNNPGDKSGKGKKVRKKFKIKKKKNVDPFEDVRFSERYDEGAREAFEDDLDEINETISNMMKNSINPNFRSASVDDGPVWASYLDPENPSCYVPGFTKPYTM